MTSTSERVGSHVEHGVGSNANRIALPHIDYPEPPLDPSFIRQDAWADAVGALAATCPITLTAGPIEEP